MAKTNQPAVEKEERSELFESKFVKQFIETFNNVLELMDEQEKELSEYVGDDQIVQQQTKPKITSTTNLREADSPTKSPP